MKTAIDELVLRLRHIDVAQQYERVDKLQKFLIEIVDVRNYPRSP